MLAIADTHALLWYLLNDSRLSITARALFDEAVARREPIGIPSISIVEITYLTEKGRIPKAAFDLLKGQLKTTQSVLRLVPLDEAIALKVESIDCDIVPDMPDRIIAATALLLDLPLLSRDSKIRVSDVKTVW